MLESGCIQALEHIHADEVIMTMGHSATVLSFLLKAAKKRSFQVIVVECAPFFDGHSMAVKLARKNIDTTVITDSAVFAMMSRVNKVIIGAMAVMADGGLMAESGTHALALAAKHHSVPLLVCAAMFKLAPEFIVSYDVDTFNDLGSPAAVMQYSNGECCFLCVMCAVGQSSAFSYVTCKWAVCFGAWAVLLFSRDSSVF